MIAEETNASKSKQIRITASQSELQKISFFSNPKISHTGNNESLYLTKFSETMPPTISILPQTNLLYHYEFQKTTRNDLKVKSNVP